MIAAILDTNVLVQALISPLRSASARTLEAYYDGRYRLVYSPQRIDELMEVLILPRMKKRHGLSDDELLEFAASLLPDADEYSGEVKIPTDLARDVTQSFSRSRRSPARTSS